MQPAKFASLFFGLMLLAGGAWASPDNPQEGREYLKLAHPDANPRSRVEVVEFFLYGCPHCNAFEPYISGWVKAHSDKVVLTRVPVVLHPGDEPWQAMYYALESLGQADTLHGKIFHAIHVEHLHLNDEAAIADFVAGQGVDRKAFIEAFRSPQVQEKMRRAQQLMAQYQVRRIPMVAVGGQYETSPAMAGDSFTDRPESDYFAAALQVMGKLLALSAPD